MSLVKITSLVAVAVALALPMGATGATGASPKPSWRCASGVCLGTSVAAMYYRYGPDWAQSRDEGVVWGVTGVTGAPAVSTSTAAAPPVPSSGTESARLGSIVAVLSYTVLDPAGDRSNGVQVRGVRLEVRRDGKTLFDRSIQCPHGLCYLSDGVDRLRVVRLQRGDPHAVVNLWSGGMRCCQTTRIYDLRRPVAAPAAVNWPSMHGTAEPRVYQGLRDLDGDGLSEFVTRDGRFPAYASLAELAFPLQIFGMRNGKLRDITRSYPDRLRVDAMELWGSYLKARRTTKTNWDGNTINGCADSCRGFLAAWAADQASLGRWDGAVAALETAFRRQELEPGDIGTKPYTGNDYLVQLEALLRRTGYLSPLAPVAASGVTGRGFRTPNGNIVCATRWAPVSGDPISVDCIVRSSGAVVSLPAFGGKVRRLTNWDGPARGPGVLGYGWRWGDASGAYRTSFPKYSNLVTCSLERKGLTCRNVSGNRFFLRNAK